MFHPNTWTENELYQHGWHAVSTFTCQVCEEEVTVYYSDHTTKKLFLTSTMEVHPNHAEE